MAKIKIGDLRASVLENKLGNLMFIISAKKDKPKNVTITKDFLINAC